MSEKIIKYIERIDCKGYKNGNMILETYYIPVEVMCSSDKYVMIREKNKFGEWKYPFVVIKEDLFDKEYPIKRWTFDLYKDEDLK